MRLVKIKLAGFKSFVDPTTIQLSTRLTGIVGPNGCGKSNVIDAVRWVMGETSAKHLRGESMEDVIFTGSNARKPVGQASVELIFDNGDGSLGGQYAQYAEIAIRRLVTRDGQSKYYLNGARCRRRDIADIFLGTGLGPRSYAIIEQGMVSRLIEAKPDEIRVYIEEAAGISRYKERRRETETRIRHTRENLDRLNDLREEVERQLERLQRQAKAAERYKALREEERRLKGELLALRWRELDAEAAAAERGLAEGETRLQALIAGQRSLEARIEQLRARQSEENEAVNAVQGRFYALGGEISRLEQGIAHTRETRQRHERDLQQVESAWQEAAAHIEHDRARLAELDAQLSNHAPALERAEEINTASSEALAAAEAALADWQQRWEDYNRRSAEAARESQVERTRIEGLRRQGEQAQQRLTRLREERASLAGTEIEASLAELDTAAGDCERRVGEARQAAERNAGDLARQREQDRARAEELNGVRHRLQAARGRLASLEALQEAALGKHEHGVVSWLEGQGLAGYPRLAERLSVEPGWEHAVETALGGHLEAVCVEGTDALTGLLDGLAAGSLTLVDVAGGGGEPGTGDSLAARVRSPWPVEHLLGRIRTAADLGEAVARRAALVDGESVITPDGIWLGRSWLRVARPRDGEAGVLAREQQIKQLGAEIGDLQGREEALRSALEQGRARQQALEEERDRAQQAIAAAQREQAELRARINAQRQRLEEARSRATRLDAELHELGQQQERDARELEAAEARQRDALARGEDLAREQEVLSLERDELRTVLEERRAQARNDREGAHELAVRIETLRTARAGTALNLERMEQQVGHLRERREELARSIAAAEAPLAAMEAELQGQLARRVEVERELDEARGRLHGIESELRESDQARVAKEGEVETARRALEDERLAVRALRVRCDTVREQLDETGHALDALIAELGEDARTQAWEERVESVERRIQRLGPINLAAIDEFKEQSERKQYLDAQLADLTEAMETLESAIHKIDRETRSRFKETFDRVSGRMSEMFPRLFGGGSAHLEMTGDDLLSTGVAIMARPPGKRISNIHLLSGGEKAMTAVAMIFAIFELNPSPFCMLDEVDAPLDDTNVGRFCDLVREMSERVQFIIITHNKITMELAQQLTGVTMREAGVSRLVSVDVDEAVQLVAV